MLNFKTMETQGSNDTRDYMIISAKSLSHAKTIASRAQAFHGTWLHIENEQGHHLARKNPNSGKWENTPA